MRKRNNFIARLIRKCEDSIIGVRGKSNPDSGGRGTPLCDNSKDVKIKVTSADVIVRMIADKPYYEIKYHKIGCNKYHTGFGSYNLDYVFEWLQECFEIVEKDNVTLLEMARYQEDLDYIMQMQDLLISENGWTIDTGNYQQVNDVLLYRLKENIKKHPFLWKRFFMIA